MAIEVTLDVYSGFENPSWTLEANQEAEFFELLNSLEPRSEEQAERPPPLGYRGFEIQSSESVNVTKPIRIYAEVVDHGGRKYIDAGRRLERWLLKTAPSTVSEKLIGKISNQLGDD